MKTLWHHKLIIHNFVTSWHSKCLREAYTRVSTYVYTNQSTRKTGSAPANHPLVVPFPRNLPAGTLSSRTRLMGIA